jgi:hypothetical protein
MFKKIRAWAIFHRKTIVLTFEIFWVLVFLLDRVTSGRSVGIPQFIYVNF